MKRVHKNSVIFRKNPTFAVVYNGSAFGFSSATLFLGAHHYRKRRIHLFRQREGVARCPAEGSRLRETADALDAQIGGLFRKLRFAETQVIIFSSRIFVKRVHKNSVIFRKNFGVAAAFFFGLIKGAILLCGSFQPSSRRFFSANMRRLPHTPRRNACAVKTLK